MHFPATIFHPPLFLFFSSSPTAHQCGRRGRGDNGEDEEQCSQLVRLRQRKVPRGSSKFELLPLSWQRAEGDVRCRREGYRGDRNARIQTIKCSPAALPRSHFALNNIVELFALRLILRSEGGQLGNVLPKPKVISRPCCFSQPARPSARPPALPRSGR